MAEQLIERIPTDPDEALKYAKRKVAETNRRYIKMIEATLKFINELDPNDRLGYAFAVQMVVSAMMGSLKGWEKWCNIKNMNSIKLEEFQEIFPKMKALMEEWLNIDLAITMAKTREIEEDLNGNGKDKTRSKPSKEASKLYVA